MDGYRDYDKALSALTCPNPSRQAEIDEYKDYDKALSALTEAYRSFSKAQQGNTGDIDSRGANLRDKIENVKKFVQIRKWVT